MSCPACIRVQKFMADNASAHKDKLYKCRLHLRISSQEREIAELQDINTNLELCITELHVQLAGKGAG